MRNVQHEKSATQRKYGTGKLHHGKSETRKECDRAKSAT